MTATTTGRILPLLRAVRRRVRALLLVRFAARGVLIGLGAALAVLLLSRVAPIPRPNDLALALAALGGLAGAAVALARGLPIERMAALVDAGAGLRERVTTALELEATAAGAGEGASPFAEPIIRQAEEACARVRARDIVPATLPRDLRLVAAGALLCVGASLIPPLGARAAAETDTIARVDAATARKIEMRARRLTDEARLVKDGDAERVGRQMEALARDLEKQRLLKRDALARITDQKENIERQVEARNARRDVRARLEGTEAKKVLEAAEKGGEEAARKEAEKLASKLLGEEPDAARSGEAEEARRELKSELQKAARAAKADASLGEKAKEALGALDQASEAASGTEAERARGGAPEGGGDKGPQKAAAGDPKAREAAKDRLAKALDKLARASAEPKAGDRSSGDQARSGEVSQDELAEAFDSLEQARARVSGSEPRPTPESMRQKDRASARRGEKSRQGEKQGQKQGEKQGEQQQQQARAGEKQGEKSGSQRHDHPQGGT